MESVRALGCWVRTMASACSRTILRPATRKTLRSGGLIAQREFRENRIAET